MGTSAAKRQVWIDHIAAWTADGQSQRAYCAAQGLRYHAFDYWRRFVLRQSAFLGGYFSVLLHLRSRDQHRSNNRPQSVRHAFPIACRCREYAPDAGDIISTVAAASTPATACVMTPAQWPQVISAT